MRYRKVVEQVESVWKGLFHCYDDERVPRTNNDLENLIRGLRSLWLRITGCNVMDGWILFHAQTPFTSSTSSAGTRISWGWMQLSEAVASVGCETYCGILREREEGEEVWRAVTKEGKQKPEGSP